MVRVITQETYDEVVRENIEEFSMAPEEAIKDAIKQFNAQGVDLSNIIKDLSLNNTTDDIISFIKKLSECAKTAEHQHALPLLNKLKVELDKDMARRVFAGKNRAYETLLEVINSCKDTSYILRPALKTITSLMTGNPDLLDEDGVNLQKSLLDTNHNDPQTLQLVLKWIRECCIKHEVNRQKIFSAGILNNLKSILSEKDAKVSVVKEVCVVLRALTLDDDVRHEYGKAHEHAATIARETLHTITELLSTYKTDKVIVGEIMLTAASLIVRNEFCQEFEDAGGLQFILDVFTNYPEEEKINWQALKLIKNLAGNDDVKAHIVTSGIAPLIIYVISRLKTSEAVVTAGLSCISALTLRSSSNAGVFYDCGAVSVIIDAIKTYPNSSNVIQQAAWAIRNMSVRNQQESKEFVAFGIEELLNNALKTHGTNLENDIKAALRDLGLQVNLREQWTGKGRALTNK
ncbi:armadillo repeat-containing protein 6 homolog isoform X3 [Phymastichus coffea]|nr:armadillo repeat-containing protein 6 homolog isoform X3 [Phymastichus coffea]XP_058798632.1 armadillo repeat-containing protein 6 homolog isoform X3 [Phymastichus coffea]XP_058798633.1 armadillo repeat-containing protein 6 homolog isoform X3 [Phymastichus coffea]XP_058798634.1 armadillo repeat-containing protein 6 homolog isoform X3 [Phymastichus coffea]XP_058798635.1 armadillo repeat-containing protein 6 homolog isoform X3 [Phymastichus coffea]